MNYDVVGACRLAISRGYAFDVAARYGELLSGENAGLVGPDWRKLLEEREVLLFLNQHRPSIETEWTRTLERMDRILLSGGALEFEEMMQVLTLRSELEFSSWFIGADIADATKRLDERLESTLFNNLKPQKECANRTTGNICSELESHWWWKQHHRLA